MRRQEGELLSFDIAQSLRSVKEMISAFKTTGGGYFSKKRAHITESLTQLFLQADSEARGSGLTC